MARDSKKPFFELKQSVSSTRVLPVDTSNVERNDDKEDGEIDCSSTNAAVLKSPHGKIETIKLTQKNENDLNALDYEIDNADDQQLLTKKSESTTHGVNIRINKVNTDSISKRDNTKNIVKDIERSGKNEHSSKRSERKRSSKSIEKQNKDMRNKSRSKSRTRSRSRNRRQFSRNNRGREVDRRENYYSPRRNDRRRSDYQHARRDRRRSRSGSNRRTRQRYSRYLF